MVLERGRVGESWRTQRWDSFRLNTPGWMNQLLGEQARDTYATGVEVVQRLEKLQQADQATPLASLAACPSGCQGRWAGRPRASSCFCGGRRRLRLGRCDASEGCRRHEGDGSQGHGKDAFHALGKLSVAPKSGVREV